MSTPLTLFPCPISSHSQKCKPDHAVCAELICSRCYYAPCLIMRARNLAICAFLLACCLPLLLGQATDFAPPFLVAGFPYLNYTFNSPADAAHYFGSGLFRDCLPGGIKVSSAGDMYVSVPRWRGPQVPATVRFKHHSSLFDFWLVC